MEKNFPRLSLNVYDDRYIIYNEERRLHEDAYCVSKFNRVRACRPIVRVRRYKVPISQVSVGNICAWLTPLSLPLFAPAIIKWHFKWPAHPTTSTICFLS